MPFLHCVSPEVLAAQRRALGPDHASTLSAQHALAACLRAAGEFAEAAETHREAPETF